MKWGWVVTQEAGTVIRVCVYTDKRAEGGMDWRAKLH